MTQTLQAEASALRSWLIDAALPFWAKQGRDANGGFYEPKPRALDGMTGRR